MSPGRGNRCFAGSRVTIEGSGRSHHGGCRIFPEARVGNKLRRRVALPALTASAAAFSWVGPWRGGNVERPRSLATRAWGLRIFGGRWRAAADAARGQKEAHPEDPGGLLEVLGKKDVVGSGRALLASSALVQVPEFRVTAVGGTVIAASGTGIPQMRENSPAWGALAGSNMQVIVTESGRSRQRVRWLPRRSPCCGYPHRTSAGSVSMILSAIKTRRRCGCDAASVVSHRRRACPRLSAPCRTHPNNKESS